MALRTLVLVLAMVFGFGGAVAAPFNQPAQVTTDVNLRSGPGTQYQALMVIPTGGAVQLLGCGGDWSWCNVQYGNVVGWVATSYLYPPPAGMAMPAPMPMPFPPAPPPFTIELPFPFGNGDDDNGRQVTITGKLTSKGVECPVMRGDNGKLYSLIGDLGGFRAGDRIRVRGQVAQMSMCMQGKAIEIRKVVFAN